MEFRSAWRPMPRHFIFKRESSTTHFITKDVRKVSPSLLATACTQATDNSSRLTVKFSSVNATCEPTCLNQSWSSIMMWECSSPSAHSNDQDFLSIRLHSINKSRSTRQTHQCGNHMATCSSWRYLSSNISTTRSSGQCIRSTQSDQTCCNRKIHVQNSPPLRYRV